MKIRWSSLSIPVAGSPSGPGPSLGSMIEPVTTGGLVSVVLRGALPSPWHAADTTSATRTPTTTTTRPFTARTLPADLDGIGIQDQRRPRVLGEVEALAQVAQDRQVLPDRGAGFLGLAGQPLALEEPVLDE